MSDQFKISRKDDGSLSYEIYEIPSNEKSSLRREAIIFNDLSCPLLITSNSLSLNYDEGMQVHAKTALQILKPTVAVQIRIVVFDYFGQHMKTLSNSFAEDLSEGKTVTEGVWRMFENEADEMLSSFSYVARARLPDGKQWVCNEDKVFLALTKLNLEQKVNADAKT